MLLQLKARLQLLLVFEAVVIRAFARFTFEFDEIILGHTTKNLKLEVKSQKYKCCGSIAAIAKSVNGLEPCLPAGRRLPDPVISD